MIKNQKGIINSLSVLTLFILLFSSCTEEKKQELVLPILGERDLEVITVDGEEIEDTVYHTVPEFAYINQDSVMVHSDDLKGKIWIADFFFSHCPSICPPMTSNMKRLNLNTKDLESKVQFLSFSIDPDRDTPTRLREYIKTYGIEANNWYFFTGNEEETHLLAKEFFNGAERDEDADGGFGHTSYFAIVDTNGYVRGIYDGTDAGQVDKLESDLRKLLKYEYNFEGK